MRVYLTVSKNNSEKIRIGIKMSRYLKRYIENIITEDLSQKMVFIGGPRQTGKTTLAKHLCKQAGFDPEKRYLNWDALNPK